MIDFEHLLDEIREMLFEMISEDEQHQNLLEILDHSTVTLSSIDQTQFITAIEQLGYDPSQLTLDQLDYLGDQLGVLHSSDIHADTNFDHANTGIDINESILEDEHIEQLDMTTHYSLNQGAEMIDPIMTVIATAAIQGAIEGLKPTAEQAIKDAYTAFKHIIFDRYNDHQELISAVEALDKQPEDVNRQAKVESELVKAGATKDTILLGAANDIYVAGAARNSKKKVLGRRLERKLNQVEALENQLDLTLDEGQQVVLKEKIEILWTEIAGLEEQMTQIK